MTTSAFSTSSSATSTDGNGAETEAERANSVLVRIFTVDRNFAALSVMLLTIGSPLVAAVLDWPTMAVAAIGLALAPYAYLLHRIHQSGKLRSGLAKVTAIGDAAWVVASVVLIVGWPDATSTVGNWLIAAIALVVAVIGLTKLHGWSKDDR